MYEARRSRPRTARRLLRAVIAAAIAAGSTVPATAATAAPLERDHYSFTDSFTVDDCGFLGRHEYVEHGMFMLKEGRAGDPTPYYSVNYDFVDTVTNVATGAWATISGNGLYKDLRITNVAGTIYEFVAIETGQPLVVRDSDGRVVSHDRGNLVRNFMIDTKGDSDPANDEFIDGSFSWIEHGGHAAFMADLCPTLRDLIG